MENLDRENLLLESTQKDLLENLSMQKGESASVSLDIHTEKQHIQSIADDINKVRDMMDGYIKLWELIDK